MIFQQNCAACHEHAIDRAPPRLVLALMSPSSIVHALSDGAMRAQGSQLSDQDRVSIAEYLTGKPVTSRSDMAEPPRCVGAAAKFDAEEPPAFPGWGLTANNARSIPAAAGLDRHRLDELRLKWAVSLPDAIRVRSEPALAGGAVYVGSQNGNVYALDRRTGCVRWVFRAASEARSGVVVSPWTAGDKNADPLVYFGDLLGNIYALKAKSGELAWQDKPEQHPNATITAAPTLYQGRLYVSVSSDEEGMIDPHYQCCTFRGAVAAYDGRTGMLLWRTFMTDPPNEQGVNSAGTKRFGPSGAPIWNSPTIDEKRGRLYVGTGDNYSTPATTTSDSVVAIDLATGSIVWTRQMMAGDAWNVGCSVPDRVQCPDKSGPDFDIGAATILAHASDGRDYLVVGQKSGMVYAIAPDDGAPIWQTKVGRGGALGGILFGMAVADDTVVVPVGDVDDGRKYDEPAHPGLFALDLKTGAYRWKAPDAENKCLGRQGCAPGNGQAVTIAGDLVIAGGNDGWLRIHDLHDGTVLWRFDTAQDFPTLGGGTAHGGSMGGGAGPLAYHGTLLMSSGYGMTGRMPGNALLMFEMAASNHRQKH